MKVKEMNPAESYLLYKFLKQFFFQIWICTVAIFKMWLYQRNVNSWVIICLMRYNYGAKNISCFFADNYLEIGWHLTEFITLSIGADHFKCCVYSYLFVSSIHLHIEKMTSYVDILLNFMPTVAILAMGEPIYGHEGHHSWNEHLLYLSQSLKLHIVLTNLTV